MRSRTGPSGVSTRRLVLALPSGMGCAAVAWMPEGLEAFPNVVEFQGEPRPSAFPVRLHGRSLRGEASSPQKAPWTDSHATLAPPRASRGVHNGAWQALPPIPGRSPSCRETTSIRIGSSRRGSSRGSSGRATAICFSRTCADRSSRWTGRRRRGRRSWSWGRTSGAAPRGSTRCGRSSRRATGR